MALNHQDEKNRGMQLIVFESKVLKTTELLVDTSLRQIKPEVLEDFEFEYGDLSILGAFWHSRTIKFPIPGAKTILYKIEIEKTTKTKKF